MGQGIPDVEEKYLKENIHSTAQYIPYLQKKYDDKKLKEVSEPEWRFFHHLKSKERVARLKKGKPRLEDIRATTRLEQEEIKKAKEYHKFKGIKLPKVTPFRTPDQPPFRSEAQYKDRYRDVISRMSPSEWSTFQKKKKSPPAGVGPLIKNLSSEDYLKYLREKTKQLYKEKK